MNNNHTPPATDSPSPDTELADAMRRTWRYLHGVGVRTQQDAHDWLTISLEFGRMGYTLTADEADWQPPAPDTEEGHDANHDH